MRLQVYIESEMKTTTITYGESIGLIKIATCHTPNLIDYYTINNVSYTM